MDKNVVIHDGYEIGHDAEADRERLIAELQVALWFLEFKNGERIAVTRIELFIIKVERLIAKGDLDPALGNDLLMKARIILELLQGS